MGCGDDSHCDNEVFGDDGEWSGFLRFCEHEAADTKQGNTPYQCYNDGGGELKK